MQRFCEKEACKLNKLKYILFDVDDTVTNGGKLTGEAFAAMWKLKEHGFKLIPVTGRPAGWCDMMLRQWPVQAVICENGAFVYDYDEHNAVRMIRHPLAAAEPQKLLEPVKAAVLKAFPKVRMAHDQFARIYDAAFDFAEDEPKLPLETAYAVAKLCRDMGAEAKVSSIHVTHGSARIQRRTWRRYILKTIAMRMTQRTKLCSSAIRPMMSPCLRRSR